jgi:hypothetical protein
MNIIERYQYRSLERITQPSGIRHYICPDSGKLLVSVTTILDQTANKPQLIEWRKWVGDKKADQIKQEATNLGSLVHTHLEHYILGKQRPGGNNYIRVMAERMADQIIHRGLVHIDEVFGTEISLYYPGLYAGTTDLVGIYKGKPAIIDFKSTKNLRTRAMIEDYLLQIVAYGTAHNELYDTKIQTGVIFMVSRDCDYEEFIIEGNDFDEYRLRFFDRLEQYLKY